MACLALEINSDVGLCCRKREHINLETVALVSILAQAKQQHLFFFFFKC